MKSRLKKVALMSPDMFQQQIDQIGQKGRDVIKVIEEYKFFIEQVSRVVKNDPTLTEMIMSKKKNIDQAAQQIYDAVFQIENIDIMEIYEKQEQATQNKEDATKKDEEKEDKNDGQVETNKQPDNQKTLQPSQSQTPAAPTPVAPQNPQQNNNQAPVENKIEEKDDENKRDNNEE